VRRRWLAGLALAVVLGGLGGYLALQGTSNPVVRTHPTATPSPDPSRTPLFLATGAEAPTPTTTGLRAALAEVLKAPGLGRRVAVSVVDVATGVPLLEVGAGRPMTPASTAKIVTAVAALTVLQPDQRFTTKVVQGGAGDVVLVGGGDPTLAGRNASAGFPRPARLAALAAQLKGVVVHRVVVDDGLFTGPRMGPGWKQGYVASGDVAPVTALAVDEGRLSTMKNQPRSQDPALEAGRQLAALLHVPSVVRGRAPVGATTLAHIDSPTVGELVEAMLTRSDNDLAEALGRQVALAMKLPATFQGGAAATDAALGPLLDSARISRTSLALRDASGLSPLDRLQPAALTRLLVLVGKDARYGPILSGLPVAGFDGTLATRYRKGPTVTAAGEVRAKTGTLDGVSALAGLVRTRGGRLLAFDLTADGVSLTGTLEAQAALDRVAATLASCGCT
jgi:D-alanyl-D-alanine carboxypeptidase/D-alanyl-D-alanine-endopeptidase (penicillin-binding protein 4)